MPAFLALLSLISPPLPAQARHWETTPLREIRGARISGFPSLGALGPEPAWICFQRGRRLDSCGEARRGEPHCQVWVSAGESIAAADPQPTTYRVVDAATTGFYGPGSPALGLESRNPSRVLTVVCAYLSNQDRTVVVRDLMGAMGVRVSPPPSD